MRKTVIASMLALMPLAGQAREYRTVTWYANHPAEMRGVLKLCRDNAGLAARNPNCVNADEAGTIILQRELDAKAYPNGKYSPYDPEYYRHDPERLAGELRICNAPPPRFADDRAKLAIQPGSITDRMCQAARAAQ